MTELIHETDLVLTENYMENFDMQKLELLTERHPHKDFQVRFDSMIGIDDKKESLVYTLRNILDTSGIKKWVKEKHGKSGLPYLERMMEGDCLVILNGDVGCGKTELAHCVGTPLSKLMGGETIVVFETPSNIRGGGHVGELSSRITSAFDAAKAGLRKGEYGILIIDEADDLATNRDQMQAHHEDRSGVNVLIKEIDKLKRDENRMAVIIITNRPDALDPAIVRRASLNLYFGRPNDVTLKNLFERTLEGVGLKEKDLSELVELCSKKKTPYSYSDVTNRIAKQSMVTAWQKNSAISKELLIEVITKTDPSPIFSEKEKN